MAKSNGMFQKAASNKDSKEVVDLKLNDAEKKVWTLFKEAFYEALQDEKAIHEGRLIINLSQKIPLEDEVSQNAGLLSDIVLGHPFRKFLYGVDPKTGRPKNDTSFDFATNRITFPQGSIERLKQFLGDAPPKQKNTPGTSVM